MDLAWCVADPHFAPADPALETFTDLVGRLSDGGAGTLVLLGDTFPAWVAGRVPCTGEERIVLELLTGLRSRGVGVVHLVGNRDYFLGRLEIPAFDCLAERWDLATAAGPVRLEHGDLINTSDRGYLRWRALSRSRAAALIVRTLPGGPRRWLAARIERAMDSTNRTYKVYRPERELASWARDLRAAGYSGAVVGHFHVDAEEVVEGLRVRFLPQFREDGAHLRIREDGSWTLERIGPRSG